MMVYSRYSRVSKKTYDELKVYFEIILEFDSNDDYLQIPAHLTTHSAKN